jgi:heme exporter protein C
MRSSAEAYATDAVPPWLAITTAAMVTAMLYLTFVWVPTEATMGIVQRIFYFHVPSAFTAFLGFIIGGVASIRFLARRDNRFDDLSVAANEVGLVFAIVNLVTGSLWAKPIWGVYWAWDARLTTMLILALIYIAYLILRQSIFEPTQRAVVCAVVSIFGMVDVPIVYMANQWWRTQHPAPVLSGEGSLDPRMRFVLYFSWLALMFVFWCLVRMRRRLEHLRRETDALRRELHAL